MKNKLTFYRLTDAYNNFHSVFKNNHGRSIYIAIRITNEKCKINECYYLDRTGYSVPKKLLTQKCSLSRLRNVLKNELDKDFKDIVYLDTSIDKESLIKSFFGEQKPKILILLKEGDVLKTIFKNKVRRSIYVEITIETDKMLISKCFYCDDRAGDKKITPYGLKTVYFKGGLFEIMNIINNELEGGFNDILVTAETTIELTKPICGSI